MCTTQTHTCHHPALVHLNGKAKSQNKMVPKTHTKDKTMKKTHRISIRITETEKQQLQELASEWGGKECDFIRNLLNILYFRRNNVAKYYTEV